MENYTIKKLTLTSMLIEIESSDLTIMDQKRMFGKEFKCIALNETLSFIQNEDFIFEINMLLFFGLDPGFRLLKKGTYPLKIHNGKIQISIDLHPYR